MNMSFREGIFSKRQFLYHCVVGGTGAAVGNLFGKFCRSVSDDSLWSWFLWLFLLAAMVIFNTIGMLNFSKSLSLSSSTVIATMVTSATNYLLTALTGSLLLGEATPLLWWIGTFFILLGLSLISYQQIHREASAEPGATAEKKTD